MPTKGTRTNPFKTSIYLPTTDKLMLDYLCQVHDATPSATIRRLITEAYSIIKYVEQK
jgi:hypothetical protein